MLLRQAHRLRTILLASLALLALLGTLAAAIVLAQRQSRSQLLATFALRGPSSATSVSTFLSQQAAREQTTAAQFLSARRVSAERFQVVVSAFGSNAAVLLDHAGRVLDIVPSDQKLLGEPIASHYAHLSRAEGGKVAVSNVVPSAVNGTPVAAVAVPFRTTHGRRVFSLAYQVSDSSLQAFVDHAIAYRKHQVFLIDSTGHLLAASPRTNSQTLSEADPRLARAAARFSHGSVSGASTPTTFTRTHVPGTSWHILIAVPNSRLYASIGGLTEVVPWLVFALVSLLGLLLVALFARSLRDRTRLADLSQFFEKNAHTDSLTGLFNRRALNEHLTREAAHSRRHGEPLSVLMVDLDRFKETNDRFGHEAGDEVLCAVADCMRDVVRADDIYGRWGGDEFLILLPSTDKTGACTVAERLRMRAKALSMAHIGLGDGISLSVGCTTAVQGTPLELVRAADLDLYRVKAANHATLEAQPID
jgi:diguanylate cyclase (GGDEF)-like protein